MPSISQFQQAVTKAEQSNGYLSFNKQGNLVVKGTGFGGTIASWFRTKKGIQSTNQKVMQSFAKSIYEKYGSDEISKRIAKFISEKRQIKSLNTDSINKIIRFADNQLQKNEQFGIKELNDQKMRLATEIGSKNSLLNETFDRLANQAQLPITLDRLHATSKGKASIDKLIENIKQELINECSNYNEVLSSEKIFSISANLITQFLSDPIVQQNIKEVPIIEAKKINAITNYAEQIGTDDTQKNNIISRLEKIRDKREMLMNQPITVHDIHARSAYDRLPKGSNKANLGEFSYQNATNADSVTRINQHIDQLAQTANAWHEKQNFEDVNGEKVLKDNAKNHITRLCTDEFAFWPKNKPLSNAEFLQIFSHVESTASQLKENLTLILASFPVEGADGKVHNTVMHVQCGATPKINVFAKTTQSGIDADYASRADLNNMAPTANLYEPASSLEMRNGVPSYYLDKEKKAPALMPFMDKNGNAFAISRDNVVHVKTAGGAQCFDVVDICLDHEAGTGERNLTAELNERAKNLGLDMMPQQVSQVISSASIDKSSGPNVSAVVLHADPSRTAVAKDKSVIKNSLQDKDLQTFDAIYGANNTQIKYGQLQVKDTHFGPPLEIEFYQPYSLENASKRVDKALSEATI